jgi:D-arabinose 1-dehydrogenase-like Zn-dependent alcohol dehydrogenase
MVCRKGTTKVQGFGHDGYYAEYAVVDARNTIILPDSLDVTRAAPLFCAGVTAFHGVEECGLQPGQWMAVVGAGGLGQLGVQYAKAMGIKVIAIDIHDAQLKEAKEAGADHTFNSKTDPDYVAKMVELTGGGVDAAINFTASKAAYSSMPPMIRPVTGILMVVGVASEPIEFDSFALVFRHYIVKGACNGTCYNMPKAIEFSAKHGIQPSVDFFSVEELPEMLRRMKAGEARGRMGIRFS